MPCSRMEHPMDMVQNPIISRCCTTFSGTTAVVWLSLIDIMIWAVFRVYRNTFATGVQMTKLLPSENDCDGPWAIYDNIFQNSSAGLSFHYTCTGNYRSCINFYDNLAATNGIVDSDGRLLSSYSSALGDTGWQFSNNSTPMDGTHKADVDDTNVPAPRNLTIVGYQN